ncbi:helix-turn-helix domain-containing protein [Rubneribacter badeniensis]|uniref:XRE family transcriptional regulator n=1 Tax=Rubneribacter badeniensis TaxID=2070688 RepID=A0A2K2U5D9_9ACTN|nr:helix-turn-helix transcriptional regulator [Rubneribacter badeniensis]OUO96992.1 transcriptional regulator [Gordonibacter sp. An232A]PNV65536.1 XRE family transcriptional regulator [Rubneribacter badeniensis]
MDADKKRALLGSAIRKRREAQGLSQQKLALMVGSSKSHIWRIETGRVSVGLDDLGRIADALDAKVRDLILF